MRVAWESRRPISGRMARRSSATAIRATAAAPMRTVGTNGSFSVTAAK